MLTYVNGSLFHSPARVLVNTVNVVGVMGKGIAKDFKSFFPDMFREYQKRCENKTLDIGKLYLYRGTNKWVLNFPTKKHWRQPSKPEYIEAGLKTFVGGYDRAGITSIAFPRLGCGNGELDWERQVRPLMEKYLGKLPIDVFVHHYLRSPLPPEHQDIKATKAWLQSEPESLSFDEVWDDLVNLINSRPDFVAIEQNHRFQVRIVEEPEPGILLLDGEPFFVPREALLEVWQLLRSAGFVSAGNLVNGLDARASELMGLLTSLPYVRGTQIALGRPKRQDDYEPAIQFLPRRGTNFDERADLPQTEPL
jgi:O-acetyl-ADP-ribose deacetylase (regulator of RNase III)